MRNVYLGRLAERCIFQIEERVDQRTQQLTWFLSNDFKIIRCVQVKDSTYDLELVLLRGL